MQNPKPFRQTQNAEVPLNCLGNHATKDNVDGNHCRNLHLFYEISTILSEASCVEITFLPILKKLAEHLGIVRGTVAILNRITGEIDTIEGYGITPEQLEKVRYKLGEGITGKVISSGSPVVIPLIQEEQMFLNRSGRSAEEIGTTSFICVPIFVGIEVIGTISVDLPHDLDLLDKTTWILTIVAALISQFVRNTQISIEEFNRLKQENRQLQDELRGMYRNFSSIGKSEAMERIFQQMAMVCNTPATVLLLGETGVGKERFARDIHYHSGRSKKPFIAINCAAIPEHLIESTLFGHEKGSFTGATLQHKGYFEQADGGTIFLDEVGELPLFVQAKFLRVLQEKCFERIGGEETVTVDVRVIAATNRELKTLVDERGFRQDLYYRLSVFPITIPPLRERKIDIMILAEHFAKRFSEAYGKEFRTFSTSTTNIFNTYSWPGNIRELENTIERAVILLRDGIIHQYLLPDEIREAVRGQIPNKPGTLKEILESVEHKVIANELWKTYGNMAKAAANLGISERIMGLRVEKYHIDLKELKKKTREEEKNGK